MAIFFQDTFTGTVGTRLIDHTPELGSWDSAFVYSDPTKPLLDGAGRMYNSDPANQASPLTNTVAPALDFYVQMTVNPGVVSGGESDIYMYEHNGTPGGYSPFNITGFQFWFTNNTNIYAPSYLWGSGASFITLPAVADNTDVDIRIEYNYTEVLFKVYLGGVLVWTLAPPDYGLHLPPTSPGAFGCLTDDRYAASGSKLTMNYLELGTLAPPPPPTAFWTDYTGSILETV